MKPGKKPSVPYGDSPGGYYCWIGPTQHRLAIGPDDAPIGPIYLEALDRFRKLVALETDKATDDYLVLALMNQYRATYGEALALEAGALERHVEGTRWHTHSSRCVRGIASLSLDCRRLSMWKPLTLVTVGANSSYTLELGRDSVLRGCPLRESDVGTPLASLILLRDGKIKSL
jgi:hypothetical protein